MAAGGHFGFWPLLGLAHTFARGIGAKFFLNTSKYPNPLSNLPLLSVVTGGPNMTLLLSGLKICFTSENVSKCICFVKTEKFIYLHKPGTHESIHFCKAYRLRFLMVAFSKQMIQGV